MSEVTKASKAKKEVVEEPQAEMANPELAIAEAPMVDDAGGKHTAEFTIIDGDGVDDTPVTGSSVKAARFAPLTEGHVNAEAGSMELLLDVNLDLSVELGRTSIPVREVLQLGPGSIVELDKLAGELVDIMANGKLIARGEVVVVDENFGVRVTEITSRTERMNRLA